VSVPSSRVGKNDAVTKPGQSPNWGQRLARGASLLAIPAFDRKAGFNSRHLTAYANDFEVRLRVLTDLARV
jgi:hypothetical protein